MKRTLQVALAWILMVVLPGALVVWFFVLPKKKQEDQQQRQKQADTVITATGASSHYRDKIRFAEDNFSGYWALRSGEFSRHMQGQGVLVELQNDGGDYPARYAALQNGEIQAAVFTLDAYIKTASDYAFTHPDATRDQILPGTIGLIIDETKGADALVGYTKMFPDIDSMNRKDTKFVLTPNSPSETLSRVVFGYFNLGQVDQMNCFIHKNSSQDVYNLARVADPNLPQVYGVWEPDLSKLLQNKNMHVIVDSSRFRGYIVDVLLFQRQFLLEHHDLAKLVVENYLRTQYEKRNVMTSVIKADAFDASKSSLSDQEATRTVNGIWFKNTSENYGHMGLTSDTGLQHIEDIIRQIVEMLRKSNAMTKDPTEGKPGLIYYPDLLAELKSEDFHPGMSEDKEGVRNETALPPLTEDQWSKLKKIGTLKVDELIFSPGSTDLRDPAKASLDKLAESLKAWPTYYVTIKGNSLNDPETALARAKVAETYLVETRGIERNRIRAFGGTPSGATRVSFTLGQQPF